MVTITFEEIKNLKEKGLSFSKIAINFQKMGIPAVKSSLARVYKNKSDYQVRDKSRFYKNWEVIDDLEVVYRIASKIAKDHANSIIKEMELYDYLLDKFYRMDIKKIRSSQKYAYIKRYLIGAAYDFFKASCHRDESYEYITFKKGEN